MQRVKTARTGQMIRIAGSMIVQTAVIELCFLFLTQNIGCGYSKEMFLHVRAH